MITVICCIYNTKSYLNRCIDSILSQTYSDFNVLLIDDGSTDGSAQILDDYSRRDARVRVIHQENKGLSTARNVGVDATDSDYIYFIDSDDYMHPQTLEILFNNMCNFNADISIGSVLTGRALSASLPEEPTNNCKLLSNLDALHILVDSIRIEYRNKEFVPICATWNKLFKRSMLEKIRFPDGRVHEDNSTAHRLLYAARRIVLTDAQTYFWTWRSGSITTKGPNDLDMIAAFEDRIEFFKRNQLYEFLPLTYRRYRDLLDRTYTALKDPILIEKLTALEDTKTDEAVINNPNNYKVIGLYYNNLTHLNGMVSWMYNFVQTFKDSYCIVIYVNQVTNRVLNKFRRVVPIIRLNNEKRYECDVLINNCAVIDVPDCFDYKKLYVVAHCDFGRFRDKNDLTFSPDLNYIAVSQDAAENIEKTFGVKCSYIEGLLIAAKPKCQRVLHLVSATRFAIQKGFDNFVHLAELLEQNDILYEWRIYSDSSTREDSLPAGIVMMPAIDNAALMSYMADADYVVQLSQCEGFGMAVHEALMMGTPVIVSDIPVFRKYVQDGVNGYIVPKKVGQFNVNRLLEVPKDFAYDLHFDETKKKWLEILQ